MLGTRIEQESKKGNQYNLDLLKGLREELHSEEIEDILLPNNEEENKSGNTKRFQDIYNRHSPLIYSICLQRRDGEKEQGDKKVQKQDEALILYPYEINLGIPNLVGALDIAPIDFERRAHCKVPKKNFERLKEITKENPNLDSAIEDVKLSLRKSY